MLNPTPRTKIIKVGARTGPDGQVTIFPWFQIAYHAKVVITGTSKFRCLTFIITFLVLVMLYFANPATDQNT